MRRRPLMIGTDCTIGVMLLTLLLVQGRGQLWLVYLVTMLYGASAVVFNAAQSALLTVILPGALLSEANAALQSISEGLRLIAPLVGAGLYVALGPGTVAVIDAATFAVSALCLWRLRIQEAAPAPHRHAFLSEVMAGVHHIRSTPPLRQIVTTIAAAAVVFGFMETLIFAVVDQGLHRPPSFLGVFAECQGTGAVCGGLAAPAGMRQYGDSRVVGSGIMLFAAGAGLMIFALLPITLLAAAVAGFGIAYAIVGFVTAVQRRSPAALQGRVYAAAMAAVGTPETLSIALGAALVAVFDYRLLLAVVAVVAGLCGIYLMSRRTFMRGGAVLDLYRSGTDSDR